MTTNRIPGGYILKARCIAGSDVAHAPPHVREIWDYFLQRAMFKDGRHIERGALATSYAEIRNALSWSVGWRKMQYTNWHCESAMKWLKKHGMIATRRTTHGFIVTVCNYVRYQTPNNYESREESPTEATGASRTPDTTEKKDEKEEGKPSPAEGDEAHRILVQSPRLRAMSYEQDLQARQVVCGATAPPLDWSALARAAVAEVELMSGPIHHPALWWKRRIEKAVSGEFPAKTPARSPVEDTASDRLAREFIQ